MQELKEIDNNGQRVYLLGTAEVKVNLIFNNNNGGSQLKDYNPVSYTHLDVYKRQLQGKAKSETTVFRYRWLWTVNI